MSQTTKKRSLSDRIASHLWIPIAMIPYLNGIGFIYVGSKTARSKWIIEGMIYEIPWIVYFILAVTMLFNKFNPVFVMIAIILEIVSIIRTIKINSQYQSILDSGNYRKSKDKFQTFVGVFLSITPFVNGIPLIYFGIKYSGKMLLLGILFEASWILAIYKNNIFFVSIAIGLIIASLTTFLYMNYNNSNLSYPAKKQIEPDKKQTENDKVKEEKNTMEKEWREYFRDYNTNTSYETYESKVSYLAEEFDKKEKKVSEIVNERFKNSITYDHFMEVILESHNTFYREKKTIETYIELFKEDDLEIEKEIKDKINILKKIIEKMNELLFELLKNNNENKDEDLERLYEEMESLTKSVKDYV